MRPQHESAVTDSVESVANLWASFAQFFQGAWVEVLVVVLALYIYLWQTSRWSAKRQKATNSGSQRLLSGRGIKKCPKNVGLNVVSSQGKDDEARLVQKLVISLMQRHRSDPMALLEQYEEVLKACGSSLRKHIPEDQNARSMYLSLMGCTVALPATAPGPSTQHPRCVDSAPSTMQCWVARLLSDMQVHGFPRSVDFYSAVMKLFTNGQHFQGGLWVHEFMVKDGIQPNGPMLITLLNTSIAAGDSTKALLFFEAIANSSAPSLRTVMTVLRVHTAKRDWQGAAKLLERLDSLGTPPDNLVLNNVLGLCISTGEVDAAHQLLHRWKGIADVVSCNILLKGCSQQADVVKADTLLQDMIINGPAPNLISYNTVMDCAVRCMQIRSPEKPSQNRGGPVRDAVDTREASFAAIVRRPWELLDQLSSQGLEPDRYTCSTLVKGMHIAGSNVVEIDRAVELLRHIGADALQSPGAGSGGSTTCNARLLEVLFNTLLDACITVKDLDRMTQIFAMMQEFNVSISAVTYGTLIKAFGQAFHLTRCHEIWQDMRRASIRPTIVTYGCYIDACIRNEDSGQAEEIFESMTEGPHAVRPNAVIYTSLIRGFANARKPWKSLALYRQMRQEGIEPTSVTYNSVLDVVARQLSEAGVLQEVMDDMSKAGVAPDSTTYSILTKASCNAGNVQNALAVFRRMHSSGLVVDHIACNTLLLACSKAEQIKDAEDVFEEMRRVGVTPSHVTTSIMVKMYGKAKMLDKAIALSNLLEIEYGQKPNLFVYTCLIQACVQNKQVRRSWDVFKRMVDSGVEPDAITYGTVIHGCVYLNKFQFAMTLVRHAHMRPQVLEVDADAPFVFASSLKRPVPLQLEVLQMLLGAVRRKDQASLVDELEEIIATRAIEPSDSSKTHGGRNGRRARASTAFTNA